MISKDVICEAIERKAVLSFYYGGGQRVVEPYLLGINELGRLILVGYQVGGYSESGEFPPWRSFELRSVRNLEAIDKSVRPRKGVVSKDFGIRERLCWRE